MASPGIDLLEEQPAQPLQDSPQAAEPALAEAQKWIEQATGRTFGDKDFRSGLENGVLLCELLNSIKPGLVKKINRLPIPIAGLVQPSYSRGLVSGTFTNKDFHINSKQLST